MFSKNASGFVREEAVGATTVRGDRHVVREFRDVLWNLINGHIDGVRQVPRHKFSFRTYVNQNEFTLRGIVNSIFNAQSGFRAQAS